MEECMPDWLIPDSPEGEDIEKVLKRVLELLEHPSKVRRVVQVSDTRYQFLFRKKTYEIVAPNILRVTSKTTEDIEIDIDDQQVSVTCEELMNYIIEKLEERTKKLMYS